MRCQAFVRRHPRGGRCAQGATHEWSGWLLCTQHHNRLQRGELDNVVDGSGWVSEVRWDFQREGHYVWTPPRPTPEYPYEWPQPEPWDEPIEVAAERDEDVAVGGVA